MPYQFPYTNLHDLDLDWMLNQVKDAKDKVDSFTSEENYNNIVNDAVERVENSDQYQQTMTDVVAAGTTATQAANNATEAAGRANSAAQTAEDVSDIVAEPFVTNKDYSAGWYVTYNGGMYLFNTFHTAGPWDSSQVTAVTVGKQLTTIKKDVVYPYGALPAGTDFDTIDTNSIYWISAANTYTNAPAGMTSGALITHLTHPLSQTIRLQVAYSNNDHKIYYRYRTSNGYTAWYDNGISDLQTALQTAIEQLSKQSYGTVFGMTSMYRAFTFEYPLAEGDKISVKIKTWTGQTPTFARLFVSSDGTTFTQKVMVFDYTEWMNFVSDGTYTHLRIGIGVDPLSQNETFEVIVTPYHQKEVKTALSFYGKRIILGGASVAQGFGGTGYAMNGSTIIDISGTPEGQAYSTGGIWKRNPDGYCWANLFSQLITNNYSGTVINNACQGTDALFWSRHANQLIPYGYDYFIYSMSSNDRNTTPANAKENIKTGLTAMYRRCQYCGTTMIVCSAPPASSANEATKQTQTWQCNEFVKEICNELGILYLDLHNEIIKYYYEHGAASAGTFGDGLHPDDSMYYRLYFCYCWLLNVSPMTDYNQPPA